MAESDFAWIMRNTAVEFTPDSGHDKRMLRNQQTGHGILDQMHLPARPGEANKLVRVCIYASRPISDFNEGRLKRVLSAKLGKKITEATVRVTCNKERSRRAVLETAEGFRIHAHIREDAHLCSPDTGFGSGDCGSVADLGSTSDAMQEDAENGVTTRVLGMFKDHATDGITVSWVEGCDGYSYVAMLEVTFVAARLLAHFADTADTVMSELAICAVLYAGQCFGAEVGTMERRLAVLPPERKVSLAAAGLLWQSDLNIAGGSAQQNRISSLPPPPPPRVPVETIAAPGNHIAAPGNHFGSDLTTPAMVNAAAAGQLMEWVSSANGLSVHGSRGRGGHSDRRAAAAAVKPPIPAPVAEALGLPGLHAQLEAIVALFGPSADELEARKRVIQAVTEVIRGTGRCLRWFVRFVRSFRLIACLFVFWVCLPVLFACFACLRAAPRTNRLAFNTQVPLSPTPIRQVGVSATSDSLS
jgi:hypothetical protein